jgi:hypothetical protein
LLAEQLVASERETYFNSTGGWRVFAPAAVFAANGELLLVWEGEKAGILAQLFDRDGRPAGEASILVANDLPTRPPYLGPGTVHKGADLVAFADKGFLLVWNEQRLALDVDLFKESKRVESSRTYALRLDGRGKPDGRPVLLGGNAGLETAADAARLDNGEIVVVWQSARLRGAAPTGAEEIHGRRLSAKGEPLGEPFLIDDRPGRAGTRPAGGSGRPGRLRRGLGDLL